MIRAAEGRKICASEVIQAQRSFAGAVEKWDEQKWVQQMRSAQFARHA
jgi:hypothetical protein